MAPTRTYSTAGAFRKALEERLKSASQTDDIDVNRLRRHVAFDRLLARLFRIEPVPWVLKGGYALELQFKAARSTVDIDLTLQRIPAAAGSDSVTGIVREMLQRAADVPLGDWFEYKIGPPILDRRQDRRRLPDRAQASDPRGTEGGRPVTGNSCEKDLPSDLLAFARLIFTKCLRNLNYKFILLICASSLAPSSRSCRRLFAVFPPWW